MTKALLAKIAIIGLILGFGMSLTRGYADNTLGNKASEAANDTKRGAKKLPAI